MADTKVDMFSPEAVHVALDLETLGTRPGSVILEIGAQAFTISDRILVDDISFDVYIDIAGSQSLGFTIDQDTKDWWGLQDTDLRERVFSGTTSCFAALDRFQSFLEQLEHKDNIYIWANSPSFDCTLLKAYYDRFTTKLPWEFRNERDLRTLAALYPESYKNAKNKFTNKNQHSGYWDAVWEAQVIKYILQEPF